MGGESGLQFRKFCRIGGFWDLPEDSFEPQIRLESHRLKYVAFPQQRSALGRFCANLASLNIFHVTIAGILLQ